MDVYNRKCSLGPGWNNNELYVTVVAPTTGTDERRNGDELSSVKDGKRKPETNRNNTILQKHLEPLAFNNFYLNREGTVL